MACVALSHASECKLFRCFLATDRAQHKTLTVASRLIKCVHGHAFAGAGALPQGPAYVWRTRLRA